MVNKKKIAVNTRFLIDNKLEGIGTYTHQILKRLVFLLPQYEFHFLFDRKWNEKFIYNSNVVPHQLSPQARHPFLWYLWFEHAVSNWLKKNTCNLFFSPDSFLSLKTETLSLLSMHDIAFQHFNGHLPFLVQKYYEYYFPKYAAKADQIITVSDFTKQDIVKQYKINPSQVDTVHCGVSDAYFPLVESERVKIRNTETQNCQYFVSVGSINPRKNLERILLAFDKYKKNEESKEKLIIVGASGWKTRKFNAVLNSMKFRSDVILKGHLLPKELNEVLNGAIALVFPSLFEGFGIPIVEAFKAEIPVITSNVSSMPEVAGDAAIFVNPLKIDEITNAMLQITNEQNRKELIEKGRSQALKFSWDRSAEQIATKIQKMIENA